jgi:glycosyltransferase involved in cell wall biosynthesis
VHYREQVDRYLEAHQGLRADMLRVEKPEALPRLMEALDVLVVPSRWEGCSRVALEGMRSGVALVAYASGGTPELVEDGRSGLLVKTGDRRALAEAVQRLVADPDLAHRLGEEARRRIEREFTLVRHLDAMEGVFAEAVRPR